MRPPDGETVGFAEIDIACFTLLPHDMDRQVIRTAEMSPGNAVNVGVADPIAPIGRILGSPQTMTVRQLSHRQRRGCHEIGRTVRAPLRSGSSVLAHLATVFVAGWMMGCRHT